MSEKTIASKNPSDIYVSLEFTPNPNTLKYVVEETLLEKGAANFIDQASAGKSPLATKLFGTPGISAVMIGRNFITITKADSHEWDQIHSATENTIKEYIASGENALSADFIETAEKKQKEFTGNKTEIETQIIKILDEEIRPAVAMDGGDITFDRFENGTVYLFMQGSCAGCPSSTLTLKMGIETRLKELIPEVIEVVAI